MIILGVVSKWIIFVRVEWGRKSNFGIGGILSEEKKKTLSHWVLSVSSLMLCPLFYSYIC